MSFTFPDIWKKANVLPVHNKERRQVLKTAALYRFCLFALKYLKKQSLMLYEHLSY